MMRAGWVVALAVLAAGCSVRAPQSYRLAPAPGNTRVLVPPGVVGAETTRAAVTVAAPRKADCAASGDALAIVRHGGNLRITVSRDALLKQPPGWLAQFAAELETKGCISPGTGMAFASRILESVPLDPSAAFRLLHADSIARGFVELGAENRLQTQAPILKSGKPAETNVIDIAAITGQGSTLNVDLRSSDEVVGVETAWYTLRPKSDGHGTEIVPVSAERRIDSKTEPIAAPSRNYLMFAPEIGYYRLIYKADINGKGAITEIVVGAPDRFELERRTKRVLDDFDVCKTSDPELCAVIPRHVALNPTVAVTVNGQEVRIGLHGTVRSAILQGGGPRKPEEVLPALAVRKPYSGKLVPVDFDRASPAILDVTLLGGESISWK